MMLRPDFATVAFGWIFVDRQIEVVLMMKVASHGYGYTDVVALRFLFSFFQERCRTGTHIHSKPVLWSLQTPLINYTATYTYKRWVLSILRAKHQLSED